MKSNQRKLARLKSVHDLQLNIMKGSIHDIKSPIGGIAGYLELMGVCLDSDGDLKKMDRYKNQIGKGLDEIECIVGQIDTIAKENFSFNNGESKTEIDIGWLVEEICTKMTKLCRQKKIKLECEIKVKSLHLSVDYILLKLIITNLIFSATKFTSKPGSISFTVKEKKHTAYIQLKSDKVARDKQEIEKDFLNEKSDPNLDETGMDLESRPVYFGANSIRLVHEKAEMVIDTSNGVVVTIQFNMDK